MSRESFHEIVKETLELHDRKNRDYAVDEYYRTSSYVKNTLEFRLG